MNRVQPLSLLPWFTVGFIIGATITLSVYIYMKNTACEQQKSSIEQTEGANIRSNLICHKGKLYSIVPYTK